MPMPAPTEQPVAEPTVDATMPQQAEPGVNPTDVAAQDFSQQNMDMSGGQQSPDMSFDGGDEESPMKMIQKITGKLAQRLRDSTESLSDKDYKYVINSVLSAVDTSKLTDGDKKSIMSKLDGQQDQQMQQQGGLQETDDEHGYEPEESNDGFFENPMIKSLLDKAGITASSGDSDILKFDIAEGIYVYGMDYNEDKPFMHYLGKLLRDMKFHARPSLKGFNDLDSDGKEIYLALVNQGEQPSNLSETKKIVYNHMISEIKSKLSKK